MALTYPGMARTLGVHYCGGILSTGAYCPIGEHRFTGFATPGEVHLREPVRVDRRDALAFLKLAAVALEPDIDEDVPWRRVFRRYRGVRAGAARLYMRYPARYWNADKAFVLAGTAGLSNEVPMRKQAFDWARR